jgi:hypothetical protein
MKYLRFLQPTRRRLRPLGFWTVVVSALWLSASLVERLRGHGPQFGRSP